MLAATSLARNMVLVEGARQVCTKKKDGVLLYWLAASTRPLSIGNDWCSICFHKLWALRVIFLNQYWELILS